MKPAAKQCPNCGYPLESLDEGVAPICLVCGQDCSAPVPEPPPPEAAIPTGGWKMGLVGFSALILPALLTFMALTLQWEDGAAALALVGSGVSAIILSWQAQASMSSPASKFLVALFCLPLVFVACMALCAGGCVCAYTLHH